MQPDLVQLEVELPHLMITNNDAKKWCDFFSGLKVTMKAAVERPQRQSHASVSASNVLGYKMSRTGLIEVIIQKYDVNIVSKYNSGATETELREIHGKRGLKIYSFPLAYSTPMSKACVTLIRNTMLRGMLPYGCDVWNPNNAYEKLLCGKIGKDTLGQLLTYCTKFGVADLEWDMNHAIVEATLAITTYNPTTYELQTRLICHTKHGVNHVLAAITEHSKQIPIFFDDPCNDIITLHQNDYQPQLGFSPLIPIGIWDCQCVCPAEMKRKSRHTSRGDTLRTLGLVTEFYLTQVVTKDHLNKKWVEQVPATEEGIAQAVIKTTQKLQIRSMYSFKHLSQLYKNLHRDFVESVEIPTSINYNDFAMPKCLESEETLGDKTTSLFKFDNPGRVILGYSSDSSLNGEMFFPICVPKMLAWRNINVFQQDLAYSTDEESTDEDAIVERAHIYKVDEIPFDS